MTLLGPLIKQWPEGAQEAYEERVAIVMLDGRIPLARAEAIAEACVRREAERGTVDLTPAPSGISPRYGVAAGRPPSPGRARRSA